MTVSIPAMRYQLGGVLTAPVGKHILVKSASVFRDSFPSIIYTIGGVAYSGSLGEVPTYLNPGVYNRYRWETNQVLLRPGDTLTNFSEVQYWILEDDFNSNFIYPAYNTQSVSGNGAGTTSINTITVPGDETWIIPLVHMNGNLNPNGWSGPASIQVQVKIHGQSYANPVYENGFNSPLPVNHFWSYSIFQKLLLFPNDTITLYLTSTQGGHTCTGTLKFPYWKLETDFNL